LTANIGGDKGGLEIQKGKFRGFSTGSLGAKYTEEHGIRPKAKRKKRES